MTQQDPEEPAADSVSNASSQYNQHNEQQGPTSPVAGHSGQEQIEPGFPRFRLLPVEIRLMIWQEALVIIPRVHFVVSTGICLPRHLMPGELVDPGQANSYDYRGPNLRDEMLALVAAHANYPTKYTWSLPGYKRYRRKFNTVKSLLSRVCPESRVVVQQYRKQGKRIRLSKRYPVHVDEDSSIFCFRMSKHNLCSWLLLMEPRFKPRQLAIEILNSVVPWELSSSNGRVVCRVRITRLPHWWKTTLQWGREAREEAASGLQTAIIPPSESLAINLEHLTTIHLVCYGVLYKGDGTARGRTIPAPHYSSHAIGVESNFYSLDPDDQDVLQYWDVPCYVFKAIEETQAFLGSSDVWRIKLSIMASIPMQLKKNRLIDIPDPQAERNLFPIVLQLLADSSRDANL